MQEKPDFRIAIVVGVTLAFLIAIGNLYWQVEHMRTDMLTLRQSIIAEVTKIADTATRAANESRRAACQIRRCQTRRSTGGANRPGAAEPAQGSGRRTGSDQEDRGHYQRQDR